MKIFCCGCDDEIEARLTDGREIYPHRRDLAEIPFWKCDGCGNHVSCHHRHHDESKRLDPQGVIATQEIKEARSHIHRILDPLWKKKLMPRGKVYSRIAKALGKKEYHTAEIRSVEEARAVYRVVLELVRETAN